MYNLITVIILLAISSSIIAVECQETVLIDSVEYNVTERWCGTKLDSSQIAVGEELKLLPEEYCFKDYRIYIKPEMVEAFIIMAEAAKKDSILLIVDSGFRSGSFQKRIIKKRMAEGESFEKVIRFVAPPGYSEHETAYAVDLVPSEAQFAHSKIYAWLKEYASNYNFYETMPEDKSGKIFWESWHWVYIPAGN